MSEERTPYVRDLLRQNIEAAVVGAGPRRRRFEFNRFEVTIDADEDCILIEDVLDGTATGEDRVVIAEFLKALSSEK